MEEHFLNTFFTYTKKDGKKPCLAFFYQNQYFSLPRWWIRSKTKHFALGLFHHQAQENENLYLSPEITPHRIYAELGGILAGLRIITIPHNLNKIRLLQLFEDFPPHYFYSTPTFLEEHTKALTEQKSLKLLIGEPGYPITQISNLTFREVFNLGIIHENQYYPRYQESLKKLKDSQLTPIDWKNGSELIDKPLTWPNVAQWIQEFRQQGPFNLNLKKVWAQIDLSQNTDRVFGLYAPLALQQACLCLPVQEELPKLLSWDPPHQIYLRPKAWQNLLSKLPAKTKSIWDPGPRFIYHWKYRKIFGKNIQQVCFPPECNLEELKAHNPTKIHLALAPPV